MPGQSMFSVRFFKKLNFMVRTLFLVKIYSLALAAPVVTTEPNDHCNMFDNLYNQEVLTCIDS